MPPKERRLRRQAGETDPVKKLAIHPNGSLVLSASERSIKVFQWETYTLLTELPYEVGRDDELVVTPDGWLLAIRSRGIKGWHLGTGARRSFQDHSWPVHRCVFLPDGTGRLLRTSGSTCTILDLATFEPCLVVSHDGESVRAAALSPSGDRVACIDDKDVLYFWDARTGARLATWPRTTYCDRFLPMLAVQVHPNARWVLSTTLADTYLWDMEQGKHRWHKGGPSPDISTIHMAGGGWGGIMIGHNGSVEARELSEGWRLSSLSEIRTRELVAALCSSDERTLFVRDGDGFGFCCVDVQTGRIFPSTQRHMSEIKHILVHPDERALLTAGMEEPIVSWDLETRVPTGRFGDSPARGGLDGDDVPVAETLLDEFMIELECKHVGFRSAARCGDGDGEEYRDEARWIELYWGAVQKLEPSPDESREQVLDRLEALVYEVRGYGAWMAPRDVKELLAKWREGS
ncbi:WD40 repeat domain-containing protein [Polyangium sp. y55x31]|uniref:WD40 repeat domain-containing protein n=1 Tax=Polyangium sp. y55x31 TaxID=3042688 RepID=UPI002482A0FA|nr:WD40 repeat domain-containing protein [Polyangium sp. y55x31]MDI1483305.1 WD40 repeat domain-containing protein [Polyangium sp. y55x31]